MENGSTLLLEDAWRNRVNMILSPCFTLTNVKMLKLVKATAIKK